MLNGAASLLNLLMIGTVSAATMATLPQADRKGAKDSPLLKRYEGSFIVVLRAKVVRRVHVAAVEARAGARTNGRPEQSAIQSRRTRSRSKARTRESSYLVPADRSPLEVVRNYQEEIKGKGASAVRMQGGRMRRRRFAGAPGAAADDEPGDVPVPAGARHGRAHSRRASAPSPNASRISATWPRNFPTKRRACLGARPTRSGLAGQERLLPRRSTAELSRSSTSSRRRRASRRW